MTIEISVGFAVVTILLFLYGAGQRNLRKKILKDLDLEKTKQENRLNDSKEVLDLVIKQVDKIKLEINERREELGEINNLVSIKETLSKKEKQLNEIELKLGFLKKECKEKENALKSADFDAAVKRGISDAISQKDKNITSLRFMKKTMCEHYVESAFIACQEFWKENPGKKVSMTYQYDGSKCINTLWEGNSPDSLRKLIVSYKASQWSEPGYIRIRYSDL